VKANNAAKPTRPRSDSLKPSGMSAQYGAIKSDSRKTRIGMGGSPSTLDSVRACGGAGDGNVPPCRIGFRPASFGMWDYRVQILPVLDFKNGLVVRGVAGRRDEYRPIESKLCTGSTAGEVARSLRSTFGFDTCYVADLDAIAGSEPSWPLYDEVSTAGLVLWIDAGTGSPETAGNISKYFAGRNLSGRIVVGLESLAGKSALRSIVESVPIVDLVFSLDLKHGKPLTTGADWSGLSPAEIADCAISLGLRSLIVLDLAGVGVGQGVPTLELCRRLRASHPTVEIITGGGVRNVDDLRAIRAAGCDSALVASALHDGRITPGELAESGFGTPNGK
jgi:phosphoribosylformimino-5-aminoimidazole carboxamide ribotide isomerase